MTAYWIGQSAEIVHEMCIRDRSKTRKNLDGKSKLFFQYVDILNHIKQYNPDIKFLFENVASMNAESKSAIEYALGHSLIYQNSNAFSAQDRP